MTRMLMNLVAFAMFMMFLVSFAAAVPLLDANEMGFDGQTRSSNYDALVDAYFSNTHVVTSIDNTFLWVPWFKTSSSSDITDLQDGTNCDSGQSIDFTHNCMVTDEFSQVGILVSMGKDQKRMDKFYNTLIASKSTYGNLPSWRIYRDGDSIQACKPGINGNCDTASDADARIIIALFTASKNSYMTDTVQKANYASLAKKLADDMLTYEVDSTCRYTDFGTVCHWLAGGSDVKKSGIGATNFAYTGYYPDAIIAMLAAYANTNDLKYYDAAKDFTLNYLQAANFNNQAFSAPPGKSFRWIIDNDGIPRAECTDTCNPAVWDLMDASRALGMCQANYYAKEMGLTLPYMQTYCDLLTEKHMSSTTSVPLQFYPDGNAEESQCGYFAQGLEALHFSGVNPASFKDSLDSALSHYAPSTKTFDYAQSLGVYTTAFAVRALGVGLGRDMAAFNLISDKIASADFIASSDISAMQADKSNIASFATYCTYGTADTLATAKSDISSGSCRTIVYATPKGDIKMFACKKDDNYLEIYGQAAPAGMIYEACLANGCITKDNGFAKFKISTKNPALAYTVSASSMPLSLSSPNTEVSNLQTSKAYDITTLPITIRPAGTMVNDLMEGTSCRKVQYNTQFGWNEAKVCVKDSHYEMYLMSSPNAASICVGDNCVGSSSGFASFMY